MGIDPPKDGGRLYGLADIGLGGQRGSINGMLPILQPGLLCNAGDSSGMIAGDDFHLHAFFCEKRKNGFGVLTDGIV